MIPFNIQVGLLVTVDLSANQDLDGLLLNIGHACKKKSFTGLFTQRTRFVQAEKSIFAASPEWGKVTFVISRLFCRYQMVSVLDGLLSKWGSNHFALSSISVGLAMTRIRTSFSFLHLGQFPFQVI